MDYLDETRWLVTTWLHADDDDQRERARQRITSLNDIGFFVALKQALSKNEDDRERDTIYWMLGILLRRTGETQVGEFLMRQIAVERKKTVKTEILRSIGNAKGNCIRIQNASNALECLSEKMRNLRAAAVESLGCCGDPRAEDALIALIDDSLENTSENGWFIHDAVWSLSEIATSKSIPCATKVIQQIDGLRLGTRKRDIKAMAVKTLAKVGSTEQRGIYCDLLLNDKAPMVKWHAMRALSHFAVSEDAPVITKRVRSILNSKRTIPQTEPPFVCPKPSHILFLLSEGDDSHATELLHGFVALKRISALDDAKLLAVVRRKWSNLTPTEQAYLKSATDALDGLEVHQTA
ncbi:MAG: HEAT repeat domain-containing protein [Planctomycetaceae bacterium]|nr:HEAT repeat domain-containing protein [Planctomycetaceae bacterium]